MRTTRLSDPLLSCPVELRRARLGVSPIVAGDRLDVAYAMGWLHARDRAFQMDMARRRALGRLSELVGATALASDRFQRRLGLARTAAAAVERLPADQRELLRRYVAGVNAGLRSKRLPSPWHPLVGARRMEPWQEADSLAVFLSLYQTLAFDLNGKLTERHLRAALPAAVASFLMPEGLPVGDSVPAVPAPVLEWLRRSAAERGDTGRTPLAARGSYGSNCWTISGALTASGKPLLACDTHLAPGLPGPWHRVEAQVGDRRIAGIALPGLPIVIVGSNGSLAWGLTNVPGDTLDLVSPADAGPVVDSADERIQVKGGRTETVGYVATAEGPLVPLDEDEPLVVRWSGLWPASTDLGLADVAWCDTLDEAVDVARSSGGPPIYLHLAHRSEGCAMTIAGRIPRRMDGALRCDTYEASWQMPVERDTMPRALVSANDCKAAGSALHDKGWNHPPGHRTQRIEEILRTRTDWNEEDCLAAQLDVRATHLDFFHVLAVTILAGEAAATWSSDLRQSAATSLAAWDGSLGATSVGAPLIQEFAQRLGTAVLSAFTAACAAQRPAFSYAWRNTEPVVRSLLAREEPALLGYPPDVTWHACLDGVLAAAAEAIAHRYDRAVDALTWGETRRRTMSHPVAEAVLRGGAATLPLPGDGDEDCVNAIGDGAIPAQRLVVTPGDEDRGLFSMIGGQSENPLSRNYRDHHRIWMTGGATALTSPDA